MSCGHAGFWAPIAERLTEPHANDQAARRRQAAGVVIHHGPPPDSIRAIAAPICDGSGAIVGALSVATVAQYVDDMQLARLTPLVLDAAARASVALGANG